MYDQEIKNRVKISVAAFAYEYLNSPIMSDADFDSLAQQINITKQTGNKTLDTFFEKYFTPDSGVWIHKHPEKNKLEYLYKEYYHEQYNIKDKRY
jgi:hypothetical protein|tara:strand:- start:604 stop:888 length:285 start_codon:yes stop_codon:yes gene_type:complete